MTASDNPENPGSKREDASDAPASETGQIGPEEQKRRAFEKTVTDLVGPDLARLLDLQVTTAIDGVPVAQGMAFGHVITVRHASEPGREEKGFLVVDGEEGEFHHNVSGEELKQVLADIYASHENPTA